MRVSPLIPDANPRDQPSRKQVMSNGDRVLHWRCFSTESLMPYRKRASIAASYLSATHACRFKKYSTFLLVETLMVRRRFSCSAALPPELAAVAVNLVAKPGQTLLDPCCGSGTILFEAYRYFPF